MAPDAAKRCKNQKIEVFLNCSTLFYHFPARIYLQRRSWTSLPYQFAACHGIFSKKFTPRFFRRKCLGSSKIAKIPGFWAVFGLSVTHIGPIYPVEWSHPKPNFDRLKKGTKNNKPQGSIQKKSRSCSRSSTLKQTIKETSNNV